MFLYTKQGYAMLNTAIKSQPMVTTSSFSNHIMLLLILYQTNQEMQFLTIVQYQYPCKTL